MDTYSCYNKLAASEREGLDYRVRWRAGRSRYLLIAPHGGWIERGTEFLADAVAADLHAFYAFSGLAPRCSRLHITSDNFDEPRALALAESAASVISIHGARGAERCIYFGGLDMQLRARLRQTLENVGLPTRDEPSPSRQGRGRTNICNRGRRKRGVQIELPVGMRKALFDYEMSHDRWQINAEGLRFVAAMRKVLG